MFYLAADCRDDAAFSMREVVVFLKAASRETDAEVLAFRKELEERRDVRVFHFDNPDSLNGELSKVCAEWVRSIRATAGAGGQQAHAEGA
jgi:hypothetical protein